MRDTGFQVPAAKLDRLPTCYGTDFPHSTLVVLDEARGGYASRHPPFEGGGGGLVSTVDDLLAFGLMMLNNGIYGRKRILSRPSIELMTTDHITPEQKATSPFFPDYWTYHSWGLGMGLVTGRGDVAGVPGRFGWDGAFGTSWWVDPKERLVGIFMSQRRPDQLATSPPVLDFWTSAYQLIED
jgi:CubicO group peptidase (beta-lactamase class C family)